MLTKRIYAIILCLLLVLTSNARALSVSNMQNTMSGIIQKKAVSRGFTVSDPRYVRTLTSIGTTMAGAAAGAVVVTVAGVTAPAWLTAALGAGIGAGITLAISALVNWALQSDGSIKSPDDDPNVPAGPVQSLYCGEGSVCASTASAACTYHPSSALQYPCSTNPTGVCYRDTFYKWESGSCNMYAKNRDGGAISNYGAISSPALSNGRCPGINLSATGGQCPASNFPVKVGTVTPLSDAVNALSPEARAQPVNPQVIADMANQFWKGAAATQGYDGLPYVATDPITASDVTAWRDANPSYYPTVQDFVYPQPAPSGGTAATPFTLPVSQTPVAQVDPATQTQTGTNPAASNPLENLGVDPGIGAPKLEDAPTAQMILSPLLNLMPSLKNFAVPNHSVECPKPTITLFGKSTVMDAHCTLLDGVRNTLAAVMAFVWLMIAAFIVLRA